MKHSILAVLFFVVGICILVFFYMERLVKTPLGRTLRATRDNEDVAKALGKNVIDIRMKVIVIAAIIGSIAGALDAFNLVVLEDPTGVQPVYEPAPRVRGEVMEQYPEIADILNPVFQSLDLMILQALNAKIGVEGRNPTDVAQEYLVSKGFLR